ncbi:MAG: electron transport complex subunit RsxC [Oscillospiraceae bacterium]|jgi:electron transport complex protein RnfC|nr:electron transport complex subunit RsxC [Oscillospiraceae bacterium]
MLKTLGGVRTPHKKGTANSREEPMAISRFVTIPMSMHRGKPAKCIVKTGDVLKVGQKIGEADGSDSAHIHSSVSGTVKDIITTDPVTGKAQISVVIETDGLQTFDETLAPPTVETLDDLLVAIRNSGVVGLGGAVAPTAPKLTLRDPSKIDYLIVNGAECEPYMTCDTRTMIDDRELLWSGIRLIHRFLGIKNIVIAIERNKPEPIRIFKELTAKEPIARVQVLPTKYPQGGKINLIYNITGRIVPEGKRPGDVGCVVINCSTLACVARYVETGVPLVAKRVTVDGSAVKKPRNVLVPLGTPISDVFEYCGGLRDNVAKVITGGPMMGITIPDLHMPVVKSTNTLLAFSDKEAFAPKPSTCIMCGKCIANCPMKLMPVEIQDAFLREKTDRLRALKPGMCVECGCCSFTCPASRPLTQYVKLAKARLRE